MLEPPSTAGDPHSPSSSSLPRSAGLSPRSPRSDVSSETGYFTASVSPNTGKQHSPAFLSVDTSFSRSQNSRSKRHNNASTNDIDDTGANNPTSPSLHLHPPSGSSSVFSASSVSLATNTSRNRHPSASSASPPSSPAPKHSSRKAILRGTREAMGGGSGAGGVGRSSEDTAATPRKPRKSRDTAAPDSNVGQGIGPSSRRSRPSSSHAASSSSLGSRRRSPSATRQGRAEAQEAAHPDAHVVHPNPLERPRSASSSSSHHRPRRHTDANIARDDRATSTDAAATTSGHHHKSNGFLAPVSRLGRRIASAAHSRDDVREEAEPVPPSPTLWREAATGGPRASHEAGAAEGGNAESSGSMPTSKSATLRSKLFGNRKREKSNPNDRSQPPTPTSGRRLHSRGMDEDVPPLPTMRYPFTRDGKGAIADTAPSDDPNSNLRLRVETSGSPLLGRASTDGVFAAFSASAEAALPASRLAPPALRNDPSLRSPASVTVSQPVSPAFPRDQSLMPPPPPPQAAPRASTSSQRAMPPPQESPSADRSVAVGRMSESSSAGSLARRGSWPPGNAGNRSSFVALTTSNAEGERRGTGAYRFRDAASQPLRPKAAQLRLESAPRRSTAVGTVSSQGSDQDQPFLFMDSSPNTPMTPATPATGLTGANGAYRHRTRVAQQHRDEAAASSSEAESSHSARDSPRLRKLALPGVTPTKPVRRPPGPPVHAPIPDANEGGSESITRDRGFDGGTAIAPQESRGSGKSRDRGSADRRGGSTDVSTAYHGTAANGDDETDATSTASLSQSDSTSRRRKLRPLSTSSDASWHLPIPRGSTLRSIEYHKAETGPFPTPPPRSSSSSHGFLGAMDQGGANAAAGPSSASPIEVLSDHPERPPSRTASALQTASDAMSPSKNVAKLASMFGGQTKAGSSSSIEVTPMQHPYANAANLGIRGSKIGRSSSMRMHSSSPSVASNGSRSRKVSGSSRSGARPRAGSGASTSSLYEDAPVALASDEQSGAAHAQGISTPDSLASAGKRSLPPVPGAPGGDLARQSLASDHSEPRPSLPPKSPLRTPSARNWGRIYRHGRPSTSGGVPNPPTFMARIPSDDAASFSEHGHRNALAVAGAPRSEMGHSYRGAMPIPGAAQSELGHGSASSYQDRTMMLPSHSPLRPSIEEAARMGGAITLSLSGSSNVAPGSYRRERIDSMPVSDRSSLHRSGPGQGLSEPLQLPEGPKSQSHAAAASKDDLHQTDDEDLSPLAGINATPGSTASQKSKFSRKVTPPAIPNVFKGRKSSGGKDGEGAAASSGTRSKKWPFARDYASDVEEEVGRHRRMKRSLRKKAEPVPKLQIRRVFDETPVEEGPGAANGGSADAIEGDSLRGLPGQDEWGRHRAASAHSHLLLKKESTASFASGISTESHGSMPMRMGEMTATTTTMSRSNAATPTSPLVGRSMAGPTSPTVGWTKDELEPEGKRILKRRNVLRELVHTEKSYAADLAVIRDIYLARARAKAAIVSPSPGTPWSAFSSSTPSFSPLIPQSASSSAAHLPYRHPKNAVPGPGSQPQQRSNSAVATMAPTPPLPSDVRLQHVWAVPSPASGTTSSRSSIITSDSKPGSKPESQSGSKSDWDGDSSMGTEGQEHAKQLPSTPPVGMGIPTAGPGPNAGMVSTSTSGHSTLDAHVQNQSRGSEGPTPTPTNATPAPGAMPSPSMTYSSRPTVSIETRTPSFGSLTASSTTPPLSSADIRIIFAGVETCAAFAEEMSALLEAAMGSLATKPLPSDPAQLNDSLDDTVGKTFRELTERIRQTYAAYCSKHEASINRLQEVTAGSAKATAFLKDCTEIARRHTNAWDLASLLIKPVQRMLKYPLLLQQIHSNTLEDHPDYENLRLAVEEVQRVADTINELSRRKDIINQIVSGGREAPRSTSLSKGKGRGTLRRKPQPFKVGGGGAGSASLSRDASASGAGSLKRVPSLLGDRDEYPALAEAILLLERSIEAFGKECLEWPIGVKASLHAEASLLLQWCNVYVLGGIELAHTPDTAGLRTMATHLQTASERHCSSLDASIRSDILPALAKISKMFEGPRAYMRKRDEREEDYAKYRAALARNEKNMDRKLLEAANGFVALHTQLVEELPAFIARVQAALDFVVAAWARLQARHEAQIADILAAFAGGSQGLRGMRRRDNASNGSEADATGSDAAATGTSTPAGTVFTLNARQVTQQWWNLHRPISELADGLAICSRDATPVGTVDSPSIVSRNPMEPPTPSEDDAGGSSHPPTTSTSPSAWKARPLVSASGSSRGRPSNATHASYDAETSASASATNSMSLEEGGASFSLDAYRDSEAGAHEDGTHPNAPSAASQILRSISGTLNRRGPGSAASHSKGHAPGVESGIAMAMGVAVGIGGPESHETNPGLASSRTLTAVDQGQASRGHSPNPMASDKDLPLAPHPEQGAGVPVEQASSSTSHSLSPTTARMPLRSVSAMAVPGSGPSTGPARAPGMTTSHSHGAGLVSASTPVSAVASASASPMSTRSAALPPTLPTLDLGERDLSPRVRDGGRTALDLDADLRDLGKIAGGGGAPEGLGVALGAPAVPDGEQGADEANAEGEEGK